ncbi:MAG: CTQ-dependent lysine 6-oxidase LodA, partial [Bacteroidota bacterium]
LPIACDQNGNAITTGGQSEPVRQFKDSEGRIKRQAARFRVFRYDDAIPNDPGTEITINSPEVEQIVWTAHIANKKAVWYQFSELEGDLMLGEQNSYQARHVPLRNPHVVGPARMKEMIDPGPRTLNGAGQRALFSKDTIPTGYIHGSFPKGNPSQGLPIRTLGEMITDADGRLLVLGGYGNAGGNSPIDTFAGADGWHDDISDGPVSCQLHLKSGEVIEMGAWVLAGSPKFAPELVNIVTLSDIMYDVGVRDMNLVPEMYSGGVWNREYMANFDRDIAPIIERPMDYMWVANVQPMLGFTAPRFNVRDASEASRVYRETYFGYFRKREEPDKFFSGPGDAGIPLMPLDSGSNSVSNTLIDKFLCLTETQYFLLEQWAAGKFDNGRPEPTPGVHPLDVASVGNCVGGPMCPGIEVTWSTRNRPIYEAPYRLLHAHDEAYYFANGLSTTHDECAGGGCEPGDLTKRMAIPWQADFFQCTVQFVNFTNDNVNKLNDIPLPPTYYAYWWPPQSPMYVLSGALSVEEQTAAGVPAGFQVYYPRGINSFSQMIMAWSYLGFIVNQNHDEMGSMFPSFTEVERNHDMFQATSVAVGGISNFLNPDDTFFNPMWFLKPVAVAQHPAIRAALLGAEAEPAEPTGFVAAPPRSHMHHGRRR